MVGSIKPVTTRRGESMAFVRLDDLTGSCEVVVVPAVLAEAREALAADRIVIVSGRVDHKGEGETKIVAQEVRAFTPDPGAEDDRLHLRVDAARLTRDHLSRLERLLAEHRGGAHVLFEMRTADGQVRLRFGDDYRVDPRDGTLIASLKGMFGERSVIA
jgi:DNA polymerase-3 subunit alpha